MINMLRHAPALRTSMMAILFAAGNPAFSQAPTDAQRSAIRSQCRSDYMAHCASVPPGGMASLQCLQKNMSSLSSGCQARCVRSKRRLSPKPNRRPSRAPAAAPKSRLPVKPAAETAAPQLRRNCKANVQRNSQKSQGKLQGKSKENPKPAASTATKKPSSNANCRNSQRLPVRLSERLRRRADRRRRGTAMPGKEQGEPLGKLPESCQRGRRHCRADGRHGNAAAATAAPEQPPRPPPPVLMLRPMRPREVLFVLSSACGGDVRALCGGVPPGGGRIMQCLATQAASLSPACTDVLSQFSAQ